MGTLDFKTKDIRKLNLWTNSYADDLLTLGSWSHERTKDTKNETYELIRILTICELLGVELGSRKKLNKEVNIYGKYCS